MGYTFEETILSPTLPMMSENTVPAFIHFISVFICACLLGWAVASVFRDKYGGRINPLFILLPGLVSILLPLRFEFGPKLIKGLFLCLALLYASCADLRAREVPDCVPVLIAVSALIGTELYKLPLMLFTALIITLPQFAIAILKPGSYGGADIKIIAACTFLLGLGRGLIAIVAGLLLAVICTIIFRRAKKQSIKKGFALVPYLAFGSMLAYFI